MDNIIWFKDLKKEDVPSVGGKGANLGEMYNIPLPIPPGFVVSTNAFKRFITETRISERIFSALAELKAEETEKIQEISKDIKELIIKTKMPTDIETEIRNAYNNLNVDPSIQKSVTGPALDLVKSGRDLPMVAIRSSATAEDIPEASFAGQQETYLNIKGTENVVKAVQYCWASLYTPRAIYYRIKNNFDHSKVLLAAVVQKMVHSEVSGIMFTINPANNVDEVMIEAIFGLGDAVVGGEVSPDTYTVDKTSGEIKTKKVAIQKWLYDKDAMGGRTKANIKPEYGTRQKLTDEGIKKLAQIGKRIEQHYGMPMDIEWAVEANKLYIVQARPITTINKISKVESKELSGTVLLTGLGASPGVAAGKVRIVHDPKEISKVEKGDILVAVMTSPDYVPAMERASAIVTDEGGITCFGGDTVLLSTKGFIKFRDIHERIKEGEEFTVLSYDYKKQKPAWKRVINSGSKIRSPCLRISVSQKGLLDHNTLDLTSDHKMYTYENRTLIKKRVSEILREQESLCLVESLPENTPKFNRENLAYLVGALLTDGNIQIMSGKSGRPRRGRVTFTQKNIPSKEQFISTVRSNFEQSFNYEFKPPREKFASSYFRGRLIQGIAEDHTCFRLQPAQELMRISQNLDTWCLGLDEASSLSFLAGVLDGDGSISKNGRLHIYVSKENVLHGIIISCMKLGIIPQVTTNRNIHHVQIVERVNDLVEFTKRVKGQFDKRSQGTRLFAAKQILSDIINDVNWKGRIKPYVKNNCLIDSNKILDRLMPLANEKNRNELMNVLTSGLRMNRVSEVINLGSMEVFNIEVDADNELDHNYVVFSKKLTPILVSNSHASIVSRELGIPCVVGTEKATSLLQEEQVITVDGQKGVVYEGNVADDKNHVKQIVETFENLEQESIDTKTKVFMNLGEPEKIDQYKRLPFDGIGLMRIEFIITSWIKKHPLYMIANHEEEEYINKLAEGISKVASNIDNKPLIVRFSDFKTNEYKNLEGGEKYEPHEDNPLIGWRGVSRYISPEFEPAFRLECRAIKKVRESGLSNVFVMLPFVRTTWEVEKCLKIIAEEGLERTEEFKIYCMVEVPATVLILEEFCPYFDGFSIGSNDLSMLILGVDRDSGRLGKMGYFNENNTAVEKAIRNVIEVAHSQGKTVSLCGQAPSTYKEFAGFLVKCGIDEMSVNPDVVVETKKFVHFVEKLLDRS